MTRKVKVKFLESKLAISLRRGPKPQNAGLIALRNRVRGKRSRMRIARASGTTLWLLMGSPPHLTPFRGHCREARAQQFLLLSGGRTAPFYEGLMPPRYILIAPINPNGIPRARERYIVRVRERKPARGLYAGDVLPTKVYIVVCMAPTQKEHLYTSPHRTACACCNYYNNATTSSP